ncbi:CD74 molecule, major histocompatibility complex, class II invariant chain b [Embiotoca jacksoni]|uniref:CD74 molecule, major histocompatibility complex, class II invariant chain b n=1 Tax=Embiotoca jacksoni TaxID=100190 RepID=UPI0037046CA3
MSVSDAPTQPLIGAPRQQTAVNVGEPQQGTRSSRAYKVAGLVLLASVLIVGQAMTVYFLYSQKSDIKSLEEQSNNMKTQLTKGRSMSVPMQMHMNAMPALMETFVDEDTSNKDAGMPAPPQLTKCQLEAAGAGGEKGPGYVPSCDQQGMYQAEQCYVQFCWCVHPVTGQRLPKSTRQGPAGCRATLFTGGLTKMLAMSDDA